MYDVYNQLKILYTFLTVLFYYFIYLFEYLGDYMVLIYSPRDMRVFKDTTI